MCIYYRPPNEARSLRSLEHRRATRIAKEFVNLQCSGKVSDVNMTDGLIAAYKNGWEKLVLFKANDWPELTIAKSHFDCLFLSSYVNLSKYIDV